jgi:hypothetical protein
LKKQKTKEMDATLHFVCGIHFGLFRMRRYTALSHFKGHAMEGLGEAIKSYFIGFRSSKGDGWIHSGCTDLTRAFRQKAVRFSGSCKRMYSRMQYLKIRQII